MNKETYIYSLEYPEGNIRYIGKTNMPQKRLNDHISYAIKREHINKNTNWIYYLSKNNVKPIMKIIDTVPIDEWGFWESYYISLFRSWNFKLNNSTLGGDGISYQNKENREKISKGVRKAYDSGRLQVWNKGLIGLTTGWEKGKKRKREDGLKTAEGLKKYYKEHDVWNKGKKGLQTAWNKGIPMREESIQKARENNKKIKRILQFSVDGVLIKEWFSTGDISKELKIDKGNVHKVCIGKAKSAKGFLWLYKDEYSKDVSIVSDRVEMYRNKHKGKGLGKKLSEEHKKRISEGRKNSAKVLRKNNIIYS